MLAQALTLALLALTRALGLVALVTLVAWGQVRRFDDQNAQLSQMVQILLRFVVWYYSIHFTAHLSDIPQMLH